MLLPAVGHTALEQYRDHLAWKDLLARQQHYLDYTAPADLVVFTEDPLTSKRLLAGHPDYSPTYVPIGWCACYVPKVRDEIPGLHIGKNGGPLLFLHGRRSRGGTRRLVAVGLMAIEDAEDLCAQVLVPASDDEPSPRLDRESELVLRRWPDEHITFRAGRPDPADDSHFVIRYSIGDQSGTIDGCSMDDQSVKMQVRDGPSNTLATSPNPLSLGAKWGGTPPAHKPH